MKKFCVLLILSFFLLTIQFFGQRHDGSFGIRGGLGTSFKGGFVYGLGVNYLFPNSYFELEAVLFEHSSEKTTGGLGEYKEKTNLVAFGIMCNYFIYGYEYEQPPAFFAIVGFGFASISVDWEESSPIDSGLGTPLPDGGSKQNESGTGGGFIINAGIGYSFGQLSLRCEIPIIITLSEYGSSTATPTIMASLGYNFRPILLGCITHASKRPQLRPVFSCFGCV